MNPIQAALLTSLRSTVRKRPLTGLEIRAARTAKRAFPTRRMGRSKYVPTGN